MNHDEANLIGNLGDDARALKQARVLPAGPLDQADIDGVRNDFRRYTNAHGVFDSVVAKQLDLSASVVNQFRNGSYLGDNENIARAINDWMECHARKSKAALPSDYVPTRIVEEIRTMVDIGCADGRMVAIVAPSGSGKTKVLEVLCERHRGRMIYCTDDLKPRAFLMQVARAVEAGTGERTGAGLMNAVVRKLRGTNRPLFLDEAHLLPTQTLSRVRSINDMAGIPIILAGTVGILDLINDRSDGRGQFASRCYQYNALEHVVNAETPGGGGSRLGRPLFTKDEIKAFLHKLQVRFASDALDLAWAIACLPNHGCLRTIKSAVQVLRRDPATREVPITKKEISGALALLFGGTGQIIARYAQRHLEIASSAA